MRVLHIYLGRFHAIYPNVSLEIAIGNTDEALQPVLARELDLAFIGRAPDHPDIVAEPVLTDQIVAFVAPGDPLLRDAPSTPRA